MSKRVRLVDTKLINGGSKVNDPLDRDFEIWFSKQTSSYIDIIKEYMWLIVIAIVVMMYILYKYIKKLNLMNRMKK